MSDDGGGQTLRGALLFFAGFGAIDGAIAAATTQVGTNAARAAAIGLSAGLWVIGGAIATILWLLAFRISLGREGWVRVLRAARDRARCIWDDRGSATDRGRIGTTSGALTALSVWTAASVGLLSHLISTRHGALLIAVTFVVAQVALAFVAALVFLAIRRGVAGLLAMGFFVEGPGRRFTMAVFLAAIAVLGAAEAAIVAYSQRELLVAVDAATWAMLAAGLTLGLLFGSAVGNRLSVRGLSLGVLVIAVGAVLGCAQVGATRLLVANDSVSARVLLSALQRASDFDSDNAPFLPAFDDCSPFDKSIGPLAAELSGDGIDSNCDGELDPPDPTTFKFPARGEAAVPSGQPDLVLVTIDSWRADTTQAGGGEGLMPNLDAFAKDAVVFDNAWSQDSGTGPSLWSLTAGKTPFQTLIDSSGKFPPSFLPEERTLAEQLKDAGYHTNALLCGYVFATKHWNLKRGFDVYKEVCKSKKALQATGTVKRALKVIKTQREEDQPFFLWLHIYDPHRPYHNHKDQKRGKDAKSKYLEEVHYTDRALKPLLDEIRKGKRRTVMAITADHGENFEEHGKSAHARTLYREVTHVPLIMWASDAKAGHWETPVAINDIHPTFLELAGVSTELSTMTSHAPVLYGATPSPDRLVFQENSFSRPRRHVKAVIGRGHHLIYDTTNDAWELYDLEADPAQKKGLQNTGLPIEAELRAALRAFIPTTKIPEKLAP